jgi:hypothetical protein
MAILNGSFEDEGVSPGEAAHWTLRSFVARERIAGFGPSPERAAEDFERWFAAPELELGTVTLSVFEPRREAFEAFEAGWLNDLFVDELPEGLLTIATFGGGTVERMDVGWATERFANNWSDVAETLAFFDGDPREGFERRWRENEHYIRAWDEDAETAALFEGGGAAETFDGTWAPIESL